VSAVEGKRGKQLCQGSSSPRRKQIELLTPYKDRPARLSWALSLYWAFSWSWYWAWSCKCYRRLARIVVFPLTLGFLYFPSHKRKPRSLYIFTQPALQFSIQKHPSIPLPCSVVSGHQRSLFSQALLLHKHGSLCDFSDGHLSCFLYAVMHSTATTMRNLQIFEQQTVLFLQRFACFEFLSSLELPSIIQQS
jgi:hypothetical protein